jgi:hypothetical protein
MSKAIEKAENVFSELEQVRFRLTTPEQFGEVMAWIRRLKDYTAKFEEKVKQRGGEIMSDLDLREIESGDWVIKKVDPTEVTEYDAKALLEILGAERMSGLGLKVSTSKVKLYIKKRGVTDAELAEINKHQTTKHRDGYIKISQKLTKK